VGRVRVRVGQLWGRQLSEQSALARLSTEPQNKQIYQLFLERDVIYTSRAMLATARPSCLLYNLSTSCTISTERFLIICNLHKSLAYGHFVYFDTVRIYV